MKARLLILLTALLLAAPIPSFAGPPRAFLRDQPAQWQVYELREDVDFPHAWDSMLDLLINDFDLKLALKEDGYVLTDWLYSYGGKYNLEYRVRVTVRFSADKRTVKFKADAQFKDGENWIIGVDSRLLSTLKTDIMGTIGRITR